MNLLARIKNMAPSNDENFISQRQADDEALLGKLPTEPLNGDIASRRPLTPSIFQLEEDNILTEAEKIYLSFTERHGYMGHEPSVLACLQQFRATKDKAQLYRALSVIHHLLDIS
jgi:hypothetical protein